MHSKYPNVFNPIEIGPVKVENRFYFAPHGINMTYGRNEPSNDFVAYSAARARGGCGLLIQSLHVHGKLPGSSSPWPEENVPSFAAMAEAIHRDGAKVFGQLFYFWGVSGPWWPLAPQRPALTPSTMQQNWNNDATHPLTREELRSFIDAYRQSAVHLRQAGYDGIEVHVSHGTLLEQFASPYFNRRSDEYGGNVDNRLRLTFECLQAAREGAGDQMAVGIRLNCDELLPGGYDTAGGHEILGRLCGSGLVDFADLDVAVEPNQLWIGMPSMFVDKQPYRSYVEAIRDAAADVPVLSVLGRVHSIQEAEEAIAAGTCDMVGAVRALITEPDLVRNARDGSEERSRTCISCNHCMENVMVGQLVCSMNPSTFRERLWGEETFASVTATPSKVVVVGGGPGGLEAARVAAMKGHEVVLFEARDEVGGGLRVWATMPGRQSLQLGVNWWELELRRLGVDVRLGTAATAETILAQAPDAVLLATGALYSRTGHSGFLNQSIPGHDRDVVVTPEDYLLGGRRPTGKVVVIDGEGIHTATGIAEMLANDGVEVELVTAAFAPVSMNLMGTVEVGFIVNRLKAGGVKLSTSTWVRSIGERSVRLYDVFDGQERTVEGVDAVLLATTREPNDTLTAQVEGKVNQLFTLGDALAPRPLYAASYEGQMFARFIGEPGAPATFNEAYWPEPDRNLLPAPASVLLREPAATTATPLSSS